MDIITDWVEIRRHLNSSFKTNFHVSIAFVDQNGSPLVTPIGSLFLNKDLTGFYFEKFPTKLPANLPFNNNICVLIVNSSILFWFFSLFKGRFKKNPAIRLYGKLGQKRLATESELLKLRKRMSLTNWLKGNKMLWGDMKYVREINFTKAEKINLGKMNERL